MTLVGSNPSFSAPTARNCTNHQSGGDNEHQRDRDLCDRDALTEPPSAACSICSSQPTTATLIEPTDREVRNDATADTDDKRDDRREHDHAIIDGHLVESRDARWRSGHDRRHDQTGNQDSGRTSKQRDDHALRHRLPKEPSSARAERESSGEVLASAGFVREQQVDQVGASDEEHARRSAKQEPELGAHVRYDRLE